MRRPERLSAEGGYSLIEVLVVLVVLGIVVTGLTTIFASGSSAETRLNNRFQAQTNARLALDRMRKEIHCASGAVTVPPWVAPPPTVSVSLVQFAFPSGCLPPPTTTVTYCTTGSGTKYALYRIPALAGICTGTGAVLVIDNLTSGSIFTYTPKNFPANSYLLGRIKVDLQVNVTPGTSSNRYRLMDDIVMRNTGRS